MPGTPGRRERRERAVARAREAGVEVAAAEAKVTVATLRRWMEQSPLAAPEVVPILDLGPELEPDDPVERLRCRARRARELADLGERQAKALLASGKASEARNAAATASYSSTTALELERAVREEVEHQVRLSGEQAKLMVGVVRGMFRSALGSETMPMSELFRWWMAALSDGLQRGEGVPQPPEELRATARAELRKVFEPEIRREVLAEVEARRLHNLVVQTKDDDRGVEQVVGEVVEREVASVVADDFEIPPYYLDAYPTRELARQAVVDDRHREAEMERRRQEEGQDFGTGRRESGDFGILGVNSRITTPGGWA